MAAKIELDDYEVANLREGLHFLRRMGGDTGDWLGQILNKLPETNYTPNMTEGDMLNQFERNFLWHMEKYLEGYRAKIR